ncbi:unnamed protein product [Paramecium sonneborni]|uniref:Mitochondrial carrier protein n=1 Tax=Paramecium sonneborni TaxID=65129 RepID=A0A8S1QJF1_9CILI|nr:unnamed protein product [Paramecium sonneborni]
MSLQSFQDTFCGAVAGFSFRFFGHPFDTVKVRMQMNDKKNSFFASAIKIFRKEGILAYYKGMSSPLLADIPSNAVLFGIYEYVFREISSNNKEKKPYILEWLIAGGVAGIGYAIVVCPAEMTKCVLQMQKEYLHKQFKSPFQCFTYAVKNYGIGSVFKGLVATILRDIPQNATFFATYEYSKYIFSKNNELPFYGAVISGALGGFTCCLASYPMDVVKTQIQVEIKETIQNRKFKPRYYDGGVIECVKYIWQNQGFKGFWSGVESCIIYYMVGCAAQFTGYYYAQSLLGNYTNKH